MKFSGGRSGDGGTGIRGVMGCDPTSWGGFFPLQICMPYRAPVNRDIVHQIVLLAN